METQNEIEVKFWYIFQTRALLGGVPGQMGGMITFLQHHCLATGFFLVNIFWNWNDFVKAEEECGAGVDLQQGMSDGDDQKLRGWWHLVTFGEICQHLQTVFHPLNQNLLRFFKLTSNLIFSNSLKIFNV